MPVKIGARWACTVIRCCLPGPCTTILPANPPAPLEDVIDGSVKTGTDLEPVKGWCYKASRAIVEQGKPIPVCLQDRLSLKDEKGQVPLIPLSSENHWFDQLIAAIEQHISFIESERDAIMRRCMPPIAVFNAAYQSKEMLQLGARFQPALYVALALGKIKTAGGSGYRD